MAKAFFLIATCMPALIWIAAAQSGDLDDDFHPNIAAPSGDRTFLRALALQPDGKIIVGGRFETVDGTYRYRLARLNVDGRRDLTFAFVDPNELVSAIAVQSDGKVVFGGAFTSVLGMPQAGIARVFSDGSLDTNFFHGGTDNSVRAVLPLTDGRVLMGGHFSTVNGVFRDAVARLNGNGTLDETFNAGTWAQSDCLAILSSGYGQSIIGGRFVDHPVPGQNSYHAIARLNEDGTRDTNFYRFAAEIPVLAMILQPDGKIIVGTSGKRLNSDGSFDSSFQSNPGPNRDVLAIALQPDGKVIMAGDFTSYHGLPANRIVRLNTNGSVDLTFSASANTNINAVLMQPDGKVLIAGEFQNVNGTPRTLVARLLGDFPVLRSFKSGANELTFSWPTAYTNYVLESATAVPSVNWQPVVTSPVMNSNNWSVTNSIGPSNQFFRLRNQ